MSLVDSTLVQIRDEHNVPVLVGSHVRTWTLDGQWDHGVVVRIDDADEDTHGRVHVQYDAGDREVWDASLDGPCFDPTCCEIEVVL